jgi:GDPmannose 4,6-dehydratase
MRRGETFVTRKISRGLANIAVGLEQCLYMGNINALRDWGHAKDFVEAQWIMLQHQKPEEFVIATGIQHSVRDFINEASKNLDMKIEWKGKNLEEVGSFNEKDIIKVDPRYFRPTEVDLLVGDPTKSMTQLGWKPRYDLKSLVEDMVKGDFRLMQKDKFLRDEGYKTYNFFE